MKSNVKLPLDHDLARLRVTALSVLGLAACSAAPDDGLVVVPMAESVASSSVEADAAVPDAGTHHRIAVEPHAPSAQMSCTRDVSCVAELASPPANPYAHPYENCDPSPLGETGHLSPMETNAKRKDDPTMCCYVSFNGCTGRPRVGRHISRPMIGRPLRDVEGAWITSRPIDSSAWAKMNTAEKKIDDARAEFWAKGGALEHASVAEFARVSLALLALGAPPDLIAETHRAALDEIEHAKICFALASRFSGRDIGPGALDVSRAHGDVSIASLVRDALRDGCLGESAAAIELREMARDEIEIDEELSRTLDAMATDEERHAALAWRIVDFAMTRDAQTTCDEIARFLNVLDDLAKSEIEIVVARDVVRPCARALTSRAMLRAPREDDCAHEA